MRDLAVLLNEMRAAGVIVEYALFGAAAQMRYTEAVATLDADVLISVLQPERLDILTPDAGLDPVRRSVRLCRARH